MRGKVDFSIKNILNKTLLFDTSKINEEVIIDKITGSLSDPLNDEYYIDHLDSTNSFTLKREDKQVLKKAKNIFTSLKTDPKCVLFSEEKIDNRLLRNFLKSKYEKDSLLLKLIQLTDNNFNKEEKTPARVGYVEKQDIDRSTLYSSDRPFQLLHADVGNLEFLGKNATVPKYALLLVYLFSSKVCLYHIRSRKLILQKIKLFYDKVKEKKKNETNQVTN